MRKRTELVEQTAWAAWKANLLVRKANPMSTQNDRSEWKASPPSTPAIHSQILSRSVSLIRGLTGLAGLMSFAVLTAEATLPPSYKPSTLIGSFHGRIEAADAAAKAAAVTALTRQNAEAASQPPAFAGMETEAFKQQQQMLANSMQTENAIVNTTDAACAVSSWIPRDNQDWGWLGELLGQTCGVGDRVRQGMLDTLRRGGQDNSVLIQRPRANGDQ